MALDLNDWARMIAGQSPPSSPGPVSSYGADISTYGQRGAHQWFGGAGSGMDAFIQALGPPANPPSSSGSPPPSAQGPGPGGDSGEADFGFSAPARGNTLEDIIDAYVNAMTVQQYTTPAFNPSGIITGRDVFNNPLNLPTAIATGVSMLPGGAVGLGLVDAAAGFVGKNELANLQVRDPAAARAIESAIKMGAPQNYLDELKAEARARADEAATPGGVGNYGIDPGVNDPAGYAPGETPVDWSSLDPPDSLDDYPEGFFDDPMAGEPSDPGESSAGAGGDGEDCVIATELVRQGIWTPADRRAIVRWCVRTLHGRPAGEAVRIGYRTWGRVAVRLMGASPAATRFFRLVFGRFAGQVTGSNPTLTGQLIYAVGRRLCWLIGVVRGWTIGGDTIQMRDR
mgnify:CR=1 FL=1